MSTYWEIKPEEAPKTPGVAYVQDGEPSAGYAKDSTNSMGHARSASKQTNRDFVFALVCDATFLGVTGLEASQALFAAGRIKRAGSNGGNTILSNWHKLGAVACLEASRGDHSIYVLPGFVAERATKPHVSHGPRVCPNCGFDLTQGGEP